MIITKVKASDPTAWVEDPVLVKDLLKRIQDCLDNPGIESDTEAFLTDMKKWIEDAGRYSQKQSWAVSKVEDRLDKVTDLFTDDRYDDRHFESKKE